MMSEFESLFFTLVSKSGFSIDDLKNKVELKKDSLGHLINDEVAVRLVARDLGVTLNEEQVQRPKLKIEDLVPGINNITLKLKVNHVGSIKEFNKKDGTVGKLARIAASDETGKINLCLWDDNTKYITGMREGALFAVVSAYTKSGLNGDVELHLGNKAQIQFVDEEPVVPSVEKVLKGRLYRTYDPIEFIRRDGTPGKVVAFILKNENEMTRVLVWSPSDEFIFALQEGVRTEIYGGTIRNDFRGEPELHINNESSITIDANDVLPEKIETKRLAEIQPEMSDFNLEGYVEEDFSIETTFSGKNYAKIMLRDGETVLPITFWNGKAFLIKRIAKAGSIIRVEGCYTKIGPYGLEINVNKWSKVKTK